MNCAEDFNFVRRGIRRIKERVERWAVLGGSWLGEEGSEER